MAQQKIRNATGFDLVHRLQHGIGQARDGHAGVGGNDAAAGARLQNRKVGVVARRPQARALLWRAGPFKSHATFAAGKFLHHLCLLFDAGGRAVKFHQQHRLFTQPQLGVLVHHAHGVAVNQLHARNRNAQLDDLNGGAHGCRNAGEGTDRRRDGLGQRVQAQRHLGDDAQRSLAAHHQPREVVARRGLARLGACAHDLARGGDHLQGQHVLAHGAVAHRVRATGPRGTHAAQRGVCARVNREKQARVLDLFIELLARHARLQRDQQVVVVHGQHAIHAREVQADAALHRQQMPFQ